MVRGFSLIYKADLTLKAFYLFYNDSNTKIKKNVTDGFKFS